MALNKVDAADGRITLQGDYVVHHQDDIEFNLEGDRLPNNLKGTFKGDMFLTNMRLIFVNESSSGYKSFSMDFQCIRNTEVKQPIFGANYLTGFIIAEPNGGWEGNANFKINFPKGGAINFAEIFQKTVKESMRYRLNGMAPPPPQQPAGYYAPQMNGYQPPHYPPQVNGHPPQQYLQQPGYYYPPQQPGFYVYQPGQPSQAGQPLYTAPTGQAPPPYQPMGGEHQTTVNAKTQEAYVSGNTAYIPNDVPPPYNPNYNAGAKKDQ